MAMPSPLFNVVGPGTDRHFRNPFHAGREPQHSVMSTSGGKDRFRKSQLHYDVLYNAVPALLDIPFDSWSNSLGRKIRQSLTAVNSVAQPPGSSFIGSAQPTKKSSLRSDSPPTTTRRYAQPTSIGAQIRTHPWVRHPTYPPCNAASAELFSLSSSLLDLAIGEQLVEQLIGQLHAIRHASGHGRVARLLRAEVHRRRHRRHAVIVVTSPRRPAAAGARRERPASGMGPFRVGAEVFHPKFGVGRVTDVAPDTLRIQFRNDPRVRTFVTGKAINTGLRLT